MSAFEAFGFVFGMIFVAFLYLLVFSVFFVMALRSSAKVLSEWGAATDNSKWTNLIKIFVFFALFFLGLLGGGTFAFGVPFGGGHFAFCVYFVRVLFSSISFFMLMWFITSRSYSSPFKAMVVSSIVYISVLTLVLVRISASLIIDQASHL